MIQAMRLVNKRFIEFLSLVFYIFGIGIAWILFRLTSRQKNGMEKHSYWHTEKRTGQQTDFSSPY